MTVFSGGSSPMGIGAYGGGIVTVNTPPVYGGGPITFGGSSSSSGSSGGRISIGLPSPLNGKIPCGIGSFAVMAQLWVDPNLIGGVDRSQAPKTKVNLVLGLCDTTLGGTVSLLNIKANNTYIYRTVTPVRQAPCTLRFYGGDQAALDPLLESKLANPTYWPKMAYIVLQGFDLQPYGGQLPAFQVELATAVDNAALSGVDVTINFGDLHDGSGSEECAYDRVRNLNYQIDFDTGVSPEQGYLMTFDIASAQEINRVALSNRGYIGHLVSLEGSDYLAAFWEDPDDFKFKLCLINANTGEVTSVLQPQTKTISGTPVDFQPDPLVAKLIDSTSSTKYLVFCSAYVGGDNTVGDSLMMVALADLSTEGLSTVIHQYTNPVATTGSSGNGIGVTEVDFGPNGEGTAEVYWTAGNTAWRAIVGQAGVISANQILASNGTSLSGIAYDSTDGNVVCFRSDGSTVKVTTSGAAVWSATGGQSDMTVNFYGYQTNGETLYKASPGYAYGTVFGSHDIYQVDLSDGSQSLVLNGSANFILGHSYIDQTTGTLSDTYYTATDPGLWIVTLPNSTVPLTDLENIYAKLAEFRGRYSLSDLVFDGFSGSECYGVVYTSDITMDQAEQDANNVFDVKIIPSDGKRKYRKAKRDGGYVVDDAIASTAIVEGQDAAITKTMQADEQSLVACRITYFDKDADFQPLTQEYRRPTGVYDLTRSNRIDDNSTSFVMSAGQAMQAATTKVYRSNFGLDVYAFSVGPEKAYLEPADIVTFSFNGQTVAGQINEGNLHGVDFTQELTITQYVQAISAAFTGTGLTTPALTDPSLLTRFLYLDGPLIDLGDDLGGTGIRQYAMLGGYGYGTFQGATLYRSTDGSTFSIVDSKYGANPIVGTVTAISATPVVGPGTDETTTLTVGILSGDTADLASTDRAGLYAGTNRALIGQPGRWTLIGFQTASLSGKIATLSNIIWGAPYYQSYLDQIAAGDYLVILKGTDVLKFIGDTTKLGDTLYYKAANDFFALSDVVTDAEVLAGTAEMPFPGTNLDAVVSGSDIDLSWDWRSRLDPIGILTGAADSVYGESALSFEIDIMSGSTVKRTLTSTTNSKTYAAADITMDFGSMPASLTFRVYQISALVDRGYKAEATISL